MAHHHGFAPLRQKRTLETHRKMRKREPFHGTTFQYSQTQIQDDLGKIVWHDDMIMVDDDILNQGSKLIAKGIRKFDTFMEVEEEQLLDLAKTHAVDAKKYSSFSQIKALIHHVGVNIKLMDCMKKHLVFLRLCIPEWKQSEIAVNLSFNMSQIVDAQQQNAAWLAMALREGSNNRMTFDGQRDILGDYHRNCRLKGYSRPTNTCSGPAQALRDYKRRKPYNFLRPRKKRHVGFKSKRKFRRQTTNRTKRSFKKRGRTKAKHGNRRF